MNAATLEALYQCLGEASPGVLSARALLGSARYRVGRATDGEACLLIELDEDAATDDFAHRLRHIEYRPRERVRVEEPGRPAREGVHAIISCRHADEDLRAYFFRVASMLVEELGPRPTAAEVNRIVSGVLELFRNLQQAGTSTVQGTWAELLLIARSRDVVTAVSAWHAMPREKFDFAAGRERLEVKSTLDELRIHEVSLEQVRPPLEATTLLASFLVMRSWIGPTVGELVEQVCQRVVEAGGERELVHRVETIVSRSLGSQWQDSATARFDADAAMESLRLFDVRAIPSVDESFPPEVRNVRFAVDLSGVRALTRAEAAAFGALFDALIQPDE